MFLKIRDPKKNFFDPLGIPVVQTTHNPLGTPAVFGKKYYLTPWAHQLSLHAPEQLKLVEKVFKLLFTKEPMNH
jgi:hypothetical protein